jgi:hypothetical protein
VVEEGSDDGTFMEVGGSWRRGEFGCVRVMDSIMKLS